MSRRSGIKLPLSNEEKSLLRSHKVRIGNIPEYGADELQLLLNTSRQRAKELAGLAAFQTIPSLGIKFAEDLVSLGYYAIGELTGKNGPALTDEYELKKGYRTDPCVEDQFWLAVHVAETGDLSRNWWDFSKERKAFRKEKGYPPNRPDISWFELEER